MNILDLQHIFDRFHPGFGRHISCGEGWFPLIYECDRELAEIDPEYKVCQIKQKFGGLRFYFDSDKAELLDKMTAVCHKYEQKSFSVCELTGKPGRLMVRNRWYKTLDPEIGDSSGYVLV